MPSQLEGIARGTATISVTVPVETLEPHLKDAAIRLSSQVKIEGFRPGKAPYDLVKQRVGEGAIYEEAAEKIVAKTFAEAVREHGLVTIGPPEIHIEKLAPGNPLVYQAKVALLPNITKTDYETLTTRRQPVEVTAADIDRAIDDLRKLRAKESAVDRPAQLGDRIEMTFRLFLDEVPVDGGQAEHYPTRLGDGQLIPGFEDQLVGMKAGEEKTFTLTFPKDNPNKQLAGKPVEVRAKVSQVFNVDLPALDDAFAKSLGAFSNVTEFRTKIEANLRAERDGEADSAFELALIDEVLGRTAFDPIPDLLLHVETNRMLRELEQDVARRGLKWTDYLQHLKKTEDDLRRDFAPNAERRVKTALLLKHVADREAVVIPESELEAAVQSELDAAAAQGILPDQSQTEQFRESVQSHLRNKKVIELFKQRTKKT